MVQCYFLQHKQHSHAVCMVRNVLPYLDPYTCVYLFEPHSALSEPVYLLLAVSQYSQRVLKIISAIKNFVKMIYSKLIKFLKSFLCYWMCFFKSYLDAESFFPLYPPLQKKSTAGDSEHLAVVF